MSLLQRLLWGRAGHQDLPADIGPDRDPDEPEPAPPAAPVLTLQDADFERAARRLNLDVPVIRAVAEIEAAGRGFLADGRPQILFEAHVFGRLTNHRHTARDSRGRPLSTRAWDRTTYGAAGAWQHDGRLAPAAALDWEAAHQSASWGLFQIMGFNYRDVGHDTIRGFVAAMESGAGPHIDAFVGFIEHNRLAPLLRQRDWTGFARRYNGPGFAANNYHTRLAAAYARWSAA
jgi:hypothetical protein